MWRPSYWPGDREAGFGGGAGLSLSRSVLQNFCWILKEYDYKVVKMKI